MGLAPHHALPLLFLHVVFFSFCHPLSDEARLDEFRPILKRRSRYQHQYVKVLKRGLGRSGCHCRTDRLRCIFGGCIVGHLRVWDRPPIPQSMIDYKHRANAKHAYRDGDRKRPNRSATIFRFDSCRLAHAEITSSVPAEFRAPLFRAMTPSRGACEGINGLARHLQGNRLVTAGLYSRCSKRT